MHWICIEQTKSCERTEHVCPVARSLRTVLSAQEPLIGVDSFASKPQGHPIRCHQVSIYSCAPLPALGSVPFYCIVRTNLSVTASSSTNPFATRAHDWCKFTLLLPRAYYFLTIRETIDAAIFLSYFDRFNVRDHICCFRGSLHL